VFSIARSVLSCRFDLEAQHSSQPTLSLYAVHSALNIAISPLIFFFSALYYTDVVSAAAVLLALEHQLRRLRIRRQGVHIGWQNNLTAISLGLLAMSIRQTNVFWVVVLNGGLEAVAAIKDIVKPISVSHPPSGKLAAVFWQCANQYATGQIHDPFVSMAWLDGEFFCTHSDILHLSCFRCDQSRCRLT